MQDRSRDDLPFLWPVNFRRLNTLGDDVASALAFKITEAKARVNVIQKGGAGSIDEGQFAVGSYEYNLQLGAIVEMKHPGIVAKRHTFEDSLDHGIVQFLSIRGLRNLQKDLAKAQSLREKVAGLTDCLW